MKYAFAFLILIATFSFTFGQVPTISSANYYQLDDEYLRINKIDTGVVSVSLEPSGANVEWDFSSVDFAHPSVIIDTISCILPFDTPFFNEPTTNYNQSNFCLLLNSDSYSPEDNTYFYYKLENDSLQFIGNWANNGASEQWFYSFSNLRTDLIFPITYNEAYTDDFQASFEDLSGSGRHYQEGSIEILADGYGRLITPDSDTIENVLRIKEVINLTDSTYLFGVDTIVRTKYYWYSMDEEGPILQFNMHPTIQNTIVNGYYFKKIGQITSITELPEYRRISIYPNPTASSSVIHIEQGTTDNYTLSVFNSSGTLVRRMKTMKAERIILEKGNLAPGLYFIELRARNELIGKTKLVIY